MKCMDTVYKVRKSRMLGCLDAAQAELFTLSLSNP